MRADRFDGAVRRDPFDAVVTQIGDEDVAGCIDGNAGRMTQIRIQLL